VIPDTRLPFDLIRMADADVKFTFGQLRAGGADINGVDAVLSAKDGVMRLDPFTIAAPNERLNAALTVDDAKTPPLVHLTVQSPGFALRPLLAVLGMPQVANGPVEVRADLSGTGDTPRALAASLDGWADVAIEGGQLDARLINTWLAGLRPLHIDGADVTNLRCFAVRADAKGGVVAIQPMALNTAALIIEGAGDVDLGHETLSLRLRPRTKIGGTGIALPVRVSGPMGAPSARIDISPGGGGPGGSGLAGLLLGGKDIMGAAGGGDPCPAALARARGGAPPSGAEAPAAPGGK
jgi:AsmA protein